MEATLPPHHGPCDSSHKLPRDSTTSPAADRTTTPSQSSPQTSAAATSRTDTVNTTTATTADTSEYARIRNGEGDERVPQNVGAEESGSLPLPPSTTTPTTNERPSASSPPPSQIIPTEPEADLNYASASEPSPNLEPELERQQTHSSRASVTPLPVDEHHEFCEVEKKHVMIPEPGRLTSTRRIPSMSMVDTKSIAARSTTVSQISKEDEELSRRVWSLYEAGGIMSDSSSQVSSEGGQRRISKIMEESHRNPSRQSMRNSYPGADGSHRDSIAQMGGSLEGTIQLSPICWD